MRGSRPGDFAASAMWSMLLFHKVIMVFAGKNSMAVPFPAWRRQIGTGETINDPLAIAVVVIGTSTCCGF